MGKLFALNRAASYLYIPLIIVWAYQGSLKLAGVDAFRHQLARHPLLGDNAAFAAWLVVVSEIGLALLLAFPISRLAGLIGSAVLLSVFTGYIVFMFISYPSLPCSCGGMMAGLGWKAHITVNTSLILISLAGAAAETRLRRPSKTYCKSNSS